MHKTNFFVVITTTSVLLLSPPPLHAAHFWKECDAFSRRALTNVLRMAALPIIVFNLLILMDKVDIQGPRRIFAYSAEGDKEAQHTTTSMLPNLPTTTLSQYFQRILYEARSKWG